MADRRLWLLLAGALLVRVVLMPLPDPFPADLTTFWVAWMNEGAQHGLHQIYRSDVAVAYPPFYLAILVAMGKLYRLVVPDLAYTPLQSVLIKLPAVVADLAVTALLYVAASRVGTGTLPGAAGRAAGRPVTSPQGYALLAAGLWAFNPAIIYVSAYWGQVDSIHTLWTLAALLAGLGGSWLWSGVLMGVAVLTKLQAIIVLPLVVVLAWQARRQALLRLAAGLAVTVAVGLVPFVVNRTLDGILSVYTELVGLFPDLSVSAYNPWMAVKLTSYRLLGYFLPDTTPLFGPITLRLVGTALLAGYTALILWPMVKPQRKEKAARIQQNGHEAVVTGRSDPSPTASQLILLIAMFAAGLLTFGFFMLATEMHERYILPALAFLALPAARDRRLLIAYCLLVFSVMINLLRILPFAPWVADMIDSVPGDQLMAVLLNTGLFAWMTLHYLRYSLPAMDRSGIATDAQHPLEPGSNLHR